MDDLLDPVGEDVVAELGFVGEVDDHLKRSAERMAGDGRRPTQQVNGGKSGRRCGACGRSASVRLTAGAGTGRENDGES